MRSVSFLHPNESLASYRYRAKIPAEQIGAKINDPFADILVVSKPVPASQIAKIRDGKVLVVDFCDDHFFHPELGSMYHELAQMADYCVCPTNVMKDRIPHKNVVVIPDPYEFPEVEPHAEGDNLLWFGHNAGIQALAHYAKLPNLTIVTGPLLTKGALPYSKELLEREMRKANIAILPTCKGHEYKSPNRLVNSLRMGLFPVCDRHPSYVEFKRMAWASDVKTGLRWAGAFKSELNDMVRAGQDYIRDRYSPESVGAKWRDFLCSA